MTIVLDKVDTVPVMNVDFPTIFMQWLAVLVDTLNQDIQNIQDGLNILYAPSYTSAEIADLTLQNGVFLYDSTLDEYVGMQAGSLVKFTTTPYP